MIVHLHRATRLLLFVTLVLTALGLTGARIILSALPHYQTELTDFASQTLGAPVSINRITTGFRGLTPEILIDNISLTDAHTTTTAIKLDDVHISVDLFALVRRQALMPALGLTIKGIKLTLERSADGSIHVHGLPASEGNPDWLFNIGRFSVSDSEIAFIETSKANHVLSLNHADLLLSNDNAQHHLDIQTALNPSYGDALRISAQFTGNPFAANELSGLIYLDAKSLNLAQWLKEQLPASLTLNNGLADIQLWGRLTDAHLQQIAVVSRLQDIALQQGNSQPLNLNRISVTGQWQHLTNLPTPAWQLTVNQLAITPSHTQHPLKPISFHVTVQNSDAQTNIISGQIKQVDLAALTQLIQPFDLAALSPELKVLKQTQLQGQLNNLGFYIDAKQQRYTVKGKFNQLGINHPDLSVQTISGEINGNQHQGQLKLNGKHTIITSPKHLREPLTLTQLNAGINWQRQADGLALTGSAIQIDLPGLTTSTRFQLQLPDDPQAALFTDWLTELSADDVSQLRHYYPALDMDSEDVAWLDRAFVSGQISDGRLSYYGPLNKTIDLGHEPATSTNITPLPELTPDQDAKAQIISSEMVGNGGIFQAHLNIQNLELIYAPDWPTLTEVNGELNFTQRRMEIHASHGYCLGLTASNTVVINEAVGRGKDLAITGQVNGSVANSLNFLQHSPLNDYVGGLIKAIEPEGDTVVDLALNVPMLSEKDPTVLGSAQFNNNRLWIKSIQLPIQRIVGQLKFNEQGIFSDNLKAVVFEQPVKVTIDNKAHSTVINAT
ncbi:YhdP family phospholipid transporter, partial [Methylocucumis oryzae]